jgi:hypothetical protein
MIYNIASTLLITDTHHGPTECIWNASMPHWIVTYPWQLPTYSSPWQSQGQATLPGLHYQPLSTFAHRRAISVDCCFHLDTKNQQRERINLSIRTVQDLEDERRSLDGNPLFKQVRAQFYIISERQLNEVRTLKWAFTNTLASRSENVRDKLCWYWIDVLLFKLFSWVNSVYDVFTSVPKTPLLLRLEGQNRFVSFQFNMALVKFCISLLCGSLRPWALDYCLF